ncbi:MAG: hypothetical protein Q8936_14305 [Bacillota bacterium]|nr:hypothetical protein [Bacillota bacterium]
MAQTEDYDIVGSYNNQRISEIDAERSINMFEYIDQFGKKPKSLINTSGLINTNTDFDGSTGGARAQFVFQDKEYIVYGASVFQISLSGVATQIGTLASTVSGYVGIDANTYQVIFVDGVNGYIWDTITDLFEPITDSAFPSRPIDVCYLDGFFVVANGNTNTFQLSEFNQGLVWGPDNSGTASTFTMAAGSPNIVITYATGGSIANYQVGTTVVFSGGALPAELVAGTIYFVKAIISPTTITVSATDGGAAITSAAGGNGSITNNGQLQLGSITSHPGTIVACRTLHRRLFLFSQFFTEVWENAGIGTNLPFRRNNSLLIEYGTPAIGSISVGFDIMVFLSQSRDGLGSVMEVIGAEPIPISTRALDFQLAQYASLNQVNDCDGFLIKENGLIFYRMNFTSANHTFVYNVTLSNPQSDASKLWHEEEILNGDRHPAQTHAYFNGMNYVGHYSQPILYQLDPNTFTNDGQPIRRARITRAIVPPGYQRLRIDRLQIDVLQGQINQAEEIVQDLDLLSELGFEVETEVGIDILLEQGITIFTPTQLFIFLSISKDGGQTYGSIMRAPMGNVGQRTYRTLWRKLGVIPRGQAFVSMFEFYDAIPFVILGASWAYEIMPE